MVKITSLRWIFAIDSSLKNIILRFSNLILNPSILASINIQYKRNFLIHHTTH